MGWMAETLQLLNTVRGSAQKELTFLDNLNIPGASFDGNPIAADKCYIEIYVESLRLEEARRFLSTFHGVVYLYETLARVGSTSATLAAVSKPAMLAKLDQASLGRVITVSRQLMGAVPWRGGTMHLELGLFSVKSGNLLSPVLDFVTQVSTTAGVSFVGAVTPFVPLLVKGMDLLAGQVGEVELEVGLDTNLDLKTSGTYAIVAKPKQYFNGRTVTIDPGDRQLLVDGSPLEAGYCVFSIRRTSEKPDFGEIPDLKDKYVAVTNSKNRKEAEDALTAFRVAVQMSPDLIPDDADALIQKVTSRVERAFPEGKSSGIAGALRGKLSNRQDAGQFSGGRTLRRSMICGSTLYFMNWSPIRKAKSSAGADFRRFTVARNAQ